jgi:hypothetical protein
MYGWKIDKYTNKPRTLNWQTGKFEDTYRHRYRYKYRYRYGYEYAYRYTCRCT